MTQSTTIRRFILGGTFSSLAAILFVKAMGFAESIFIARILGANGFGLLALVLSITNIMIALATLGIPPALTKFLSGEVSTSSEGSRRTLHAAVSLSAASTAAVCIAAIPIGFFLLAPYYRNPDFWNMLMVAILFVGLTTPFILFANALQGLGKVTRLNVLSMGASAVALPLAIGLALTLAERGALIAFLVGSALPGVFAVRYVYAGIRALPTQNAASSVGAGTLLNYGFPVVLSGIAVLVAFYVVNSWLAAAVGLADLGNYAVATSLAATIGFIPSAVGVPLAPILSSLNVSDPRHGRSLVPRIMRITAFLAVPVVITVIVFAGDIIGLAYGSEFARAGPLLVILAASALIASITGVVGSQIAGSGKMWLGLILNLLWVGVVVSSSAILIPTFGAIGASLAILGGYVVLGFVLIIVGIWRLSLRFDGVLVPAAWSLSFVCLALISGALTMPGRFAVGTAVLSMSVVTMYRLLKPEEKQLARDALAMLGLQPRAP